MKHWLDGLVGINTSDNETWLHELKVWARRDVIFECDNATYRDARHASDGIEHGFLDFDEINRRAVAVTADTFGYIRRSILGLLDVPAAEFGDLYDRVPRDVSSLRKIIRGHFVGDGSDPAPANGEYPNLEWTSGIRTVERVGDTFTFSFQERFTVRSAPEYGFRGSALEARGRLEPGDNPVSLSEVAQISEEATATTSNADLFNILRRVTRLATTAAAPSATIGIPSLLANVFGIYVEQVSLLEAIEVLLRDTRPVEAMVLLRSLMLGACQLELIADHTDHAGAAIRLELDALERRARMFEPESTETSRIQEQTVGYRSLAAERHIAIPDSLPSMEDTTFFVRSTRSFRLLEEVATPSGLAATLHTVTNDEGVPSLNTRIADNVLLSGIIADSADAILASAIALTHALDWPLDNNLAEEVARDIDRLSSEGSTG